MPDTYAYPDGRQFIIQRGFPISGGGFISRQNNPLSTPFDVEQLLNYLGPASLLCIWQKHYAHTNISGVLFVTPGQIRDRLKQDILTGALRLITYTDPQDAPEAVDTAIRNARNGLKMQLNMIIQSELKEKAVLEKEYQKLSALQKGLTSTGAAAKGLGKAGMDFLIWTDNIMEVVDLNRRAMRVAQAAHQTYWGKEKKTFGANLMEAEYQALIKALGFDPSKITRAQIQEAVELAKLIWDDEETRGIIARFAVDYAKAQHHTELTEMAGGLTFEVVLTIIIAALTGGVGAAAAAAKNALFITRFEKAGEFLLTIGRKLKRLKIGRKPKLIGSDVTPIAPAHTPKTRHEKADDVLRDADNKPPAKTKSTMEARKGVPPTSLTDAEKRLKSMSDDIAEHGYKPKYTDDQLKAMAVAGTISNERFHVRFMEDSYQWARGTAPDPNNLTGLLGREMAGETGTGPKYWSTTFDQIEDADTDPKLISEKLGLEYQPSKKYVMIIVDAEKAVPLTGVESVSATFENVAKFANRELPDKFPKAFTDQVMTDEFQKAYAGEHQKAIDSGILKDEWDTSADKFEAYLNTTSLDADKKELMVDRMKMHAIVGNNQYYEGNGLTKDKIAGSGNDYGVVETLNFERAPTNLQKLKDAGAITIIPLGK